MGAGVCTDGRGRRPAVTFPVTFYVLEELKTLKRWSWREELNHPTVAVSALKLASPAPAEGASPLAHSPRRGHIPFETPRLEVQLYGAGERN